MSAAALSETEQSLIRRSKPQGFNDDCLVTWAPPETTGLAFSMIPGNTGRFWNVEIGGETVVCWERAADAEAISQMESGALRQSKLPPRLLRDLEVNVGRIRGPGSLSDQRGGWDSHVCEVFSSCLRDGAQSRGLVYRAGPKISPWETSSDFVCLRAIQRIEEVAPLFLVVDARGGKGRRKYMR